MIHFSRPRPRPRPRLHSRLTVATVFLGALVTASSAGAQGAASATLTIQTQVVAPLAIAVTHALDFGRVFALTNKVVAANSASSGRFEIAGESGSAIIISLLMPTTLAPTAGGGGSVPVSTWTYLMGDNAALTGAAAGSFNGGVTVPLSASLGGTSGTTKLYFGVGATLQTLPSQAAGMYTATAQITAAYADL